jgi:hypothetical protein
VKKRWWDTAAYGLDGAMVATPFFQRDRIYMRTHEALYCVGPKEQK